jgi:hypothetical protein
MTDHPITPPPELVSEWARNRGYLCSSELWDYIATKAARWGADQELAACCEYLKRWEPEDVTEFCDLRRPKPPTLKEQALAALARLKSGALCADRVTDESTIRRALEALPE